MKRPVIIPSELSGYEKLNQQEQAYIYNWYYEQKDKLMKEPVIQQFMQLASQREKIRLDCITKHGEYTVAGKEEFERRCKAEIPRWPELRKVYDSKFNPINEELNRKTLAITWKRQTGVDVLGKPLLTPEEWLEQYDNATTLQRNRMELPYVEKVRPVGRTPFYADKLIAGNIQEILDWGFATCDSCSGMLADHPDRRYYKDSPDNGETYKEGQPRHLSLYGSYAYVCFPKPESNWEPSLKNTQQQIDTIRRVAGENGWIALDMDSMLQPALRLELPMTYDGSSVAEIVREAERLGEKTVPGFNALNYPDKYAAMFPLNRQVAKKHGGIVPWNDPLMTDRWNALSRGLKQAVELQRMADADLNRITDARLITKSDGSQAVRCCIDGVQQSMKDIPCNIQRDIQDRGISRKEICAMVYKDELSAFQGVQDQRSTGFKR